MRFIYSAVLAALSRVTVTSPVVSTIGPTPSGIVTCVETLTPNAFSNPSWEAGTDGWTVQTPGVAIITDQFSTDGSQALQ